ncbi:MAG: hypothetical protein ACK56I_11650, partial [bacterium]
MPRSRPRARGERTPARRRGHDATKPNSSLCLGGDLRCSHRRNDDATGDLHPQRRDQFVEGEHGHIEQIVLDQFAQVTTNLDRGQYQVRAAARNLRADSRHDSLG